MDVLVGGHLRKISNVIDFFCQQINFYCQKGRIQLRKQKRLITRQIINSLPQLQHNTLGKKKKLIRNITFGRHKLKNFLSFLILSLLTIQKMQSCTISVNGTVNVSRSNTCARLYYSEEESKQKDITIVLSNFAFFVSFHDRNSQNFKF